MSEGETASPAQSCLESGWALGALACWQPQCLCPSHTPSSEGHRRRWWEGGEVLCAAPRPALCPEPRMCAQWWAGNVQQLPLWGRVEPRLAAFANFFGVNASRLISSYLSM